jgi:hypothetical protein
MVPRAKKAALAAAVRRWRSSASASLARWYSANERDSSSAATASKSLLEEVAADADEEGVCGSVGGGRGDSAGDEAEAAAANESAADGGGVCSGLNGACCEADDDRLDSGVVGTADADGFEGAGAGEAGAGADATGGGVSAMRTPQCGHCHESDCCARRRRSSGEWSSAPIAPLPRVGMKPISAARMVRTAVSEKHDDKKRTRRRYTR